MGDNVGTPVGAAVGAVVGRYVGAPCSVTLLVATTIELVLITPVEAIKLETAVLTTVVSEESATAVEDDVMP